MPCRILFVPVSSPEGVGEYMRSLILAQSLTSQHSDLDLRFILNQDAPYHRDCPYPVTLCPGSPTHHNILVNQQIQMFQPHIVVFDASGRVAQLAAAKAVGAHTIFICQHAKKLHKGLSLRRLRFTDAIWVVQPKAIMPPLSWWAMRKLRWLHKPEPRYLGAIYQSPSVNEHAQVLERFKLRKNNYIIFSAGSGSHLLNGESAAEIFAKAAEHVSEKTPYTCIFISGVGARASVHITPTMLTLGSLTPMVFIALLSQARLAVLSGGDSLLQAISLNVPVVCTAVAKDQQQRIDNCVKTFGTRLVATKPKPLALAAAALDQCENFAAVRADIATHTEAASGPEASVPSGLTTALSYFNNLITEVRHT